MSIGITAIEAWPIAGDGFTISRETKKDAHVVTVTLNVDGVSGCGECVPLRRYGHTPEKIKAEIDAYLAAGLPLDRIAVQKNMVPGPARFALDTAIARIESVSQKISFATVFGLVDVPKTLPTAFTIGGAAPEIMAGHARGCEHFRWIKIKLMGDGLDEARLSAIHAAMPHKELIVDANEGLNIGQLEKLLPVFSSCGVVAIEQPVPQADDDVLRGFQSPIPLVADESCHAISDLEKLHGKYDIVNLKLDKTGGLTHALEMKKAARSMGFGIMVGCMVSTSLSMAPAFLLGMDAELTDLDGALLLKADRVPPLISYRDGQIYLIE